MSSQSTNAVIGLKKNNDIFVFLNKKDAPKHSEKFDINVEPAFSSYNQWVTHWSESLTPCCRIHCTMLSSPPRSVFGSLSVWNHTDQHFQRDHIKQTTPLGWTGPLLERDYDGGELWYFIGSVGLLRFKRRGLNVCLKNIIFSSNIFYFLFIFLRCLLRQIYKTGPWSN